MLGIKREHLDLKKEKIGMNRENMSLKTEISEMN